MHLLLFVNDDSLSTLYSRKQSVNTETFFSHTCCSLLCHFLSLKLYVELLNIKIIAVCSYFQINRMFNLFMAQTDFMDKTPSATFYPYFQMIRTVSILFNCLRNLELIFFSILLPIVIG